MNLKLGPITISLLVHALLAAVFLISWQSHSTPKRITPPQYIEAKLVKLKAETKQVAQKRKPKKVDLTRKKSSAAPKKASPAPSSKKKETKAEDKKKDDDAAKRLAEQQRKEKERLRMLEELEKDFKADDLAVADDVSEQEALSYKQAIFNRVRDNWSRPPSARTGMKCELVIEIVPTGRVVTVTIVESSGNSAFDRSAQQAVYKAESFPELKGMSPQTFEKYYRRFHLIFNPQDLRQ